MEASGVAAADSVTSAGGDPPAASPPEHVTAILVVEASANGGSGAFLVRADDGGRYWCKPLNNGQSPRVPINEQIVGRLAGLIGVHVCEPRLVRIVPALAGWEFRPGKHVEEGWAHGSLAVESAVETRQLEHRGDDDNARRHAGFFAVYDWLGGADPQWLYSTSESYAYYQHDSGHYLWGPDWTIETLQQRLGQANPLPQSAEGLDRPELDRLASALDALAREEILDSLANIEAVWPINQAEIEAVIDFANGRRREVAARLRNL